MYYVYKIVNLSNNKVYIGCTNNIKRRTEYHLDRLNRNCHDNKFLQKDWNFFGHEYFDIEIIESFIEDDKFEKEIFYIKEYDSLFPSGYNLTVGGKGITGFKQCEDQKINHSIKMQGKNNSRYNKKMNVGKYKGVYTHRKKNNNYVYYDAKMTINKESIWIGGFTKEKDAAIAYDDYCWEIYHDLSHLNFPERKAIQFSIYKDL